MNNEEHSVELPPEETIIMKNKASYKKSRFNFIGGSLILTNETLYFQPHKANLTRESKEIPLKTIHVTRKATSLGFISNRLMISDQDGREYIFIVKKRNQFLEALDQQLQLI